MEVSKVLIRTLKPEEKKGIQMSVDLYEEIKREIVYLLRDEEEVPLQIFFEVLHQRFVDLLGEKTSWYLYHVKLDLETRAVLKVEHFKEKGNIRTVVRMTADYGNRQPSLTIL